MAGRTGGRLEESKIRLTQPSLAGTGAELGNKTHVLTKYSSRRGKQTIIKSDHNLLQGIFSISYNKVKRKVVREVFNFKTIEGQKKFFEITDNTKQFSDCFSNEDFVLSKPNQQVLETHEGCISSKFQKN